MSPVQTLGALVVLLGVMALPRLAKSARGLGVIALAGGLAAVAVWNGWAAALPAAVDRAAVLLGMIPLGAALALGLVVRGVGLAGRKRGWPVAADWVVSLGAAVILGISFLRLFDKI